jgi:toxin YoeB
MSERSLEFDIDAFEDLAWWIQQDRRAALKIIELVLDIRRNPFSGMGKPEPLKRDLAGCWSRRINQEHRLIYQVNDEKIRILACRYHY